MCGNKGNGRLLSKVPCAMTVAGLDTGGGAGIAADLKSFAALKVYGTCVITAVTAQNTMGVYKIFPIPAGIVKSQLEAVLQDINVKFVKTGMLYNEDIMKVVSEFIDNYRLKVVVDPVMKAGTGRSLLMNRDVNSLVSIMLPRAYIVTPNRYEAEVLSGMEINCIDDMKDAALHIHRLGPEAVLIKGGHFKGNTVKDILLYKGRFRMFEKERLDVQPHGGGCSFSAAITGYLSLGYNLVDSVSKAEEFIHDALRFCLSVGSGRRPVNPMAKLYKEADKIKVLENVEKAAYELCRCKDVYPYIAEVGTQIAMATEHASSEFDVAAIDGRIIKFRDGAKPAGPVRFGASSHMARLILTAMKFNPDVKAAMNLHYNRRLVDEFLRAGYRVTSFDRAKEPPQIKAIEGKTLIWAIEEISSRTRLVPDLIYDEGEVGKEPMIRVLGKSAIDVVNKVLRVIGGLRKSTTGGQT